jgi:hypothetical protein
LSLSRQRPCGSVGCSLVIRRGFAGRLGRWQTHPEMSVESSARIITNLTITHLTRVAEVGCSRSVKQLREQQKECGPSAHRSACTLSGKKTPIMPTSAKPMEIIASICSGDR